MLPADVKGPSGVRVDRPFVAMPLPLELTQSKRRLYARAPGARLQGGGKPRRRRGGHRICSLLPADNLVVRPSWPPLLTISPSHFVLPHVVHTDRSLACIREDVLGLLSISGCFGVQPCVLVRNQVLGLIIMCALVVFMSVGGLFFAATYMRMMADIQFRRWAPAMRPPGG